MPGQGCSSQSCEKYGYYEKAKSSSFNQFKVQNGLGESEDSKFYIKYGSGLVKGKVARDDIQLGDRSSQPVWQWFSLVMQDLSS